MDGTAYIGLGSNLGDRLGQLRQALRILDERTVGVVEVSGLYQTEPRHVTAQPTFLNAAARVQVEDSPPELMALLQTIERELGRRRTQRFGPRSIDLDILLGGVDGRLIHDSPLVTIPHPRLHERRFALQPLRDIAPGLCHPLLGLSIDALAREASDGWVEIVDKSGWHLAIGATTCGSQ